MEDDVGKEFQASFEVYRERRSVDACLLFGGECVEFASDAVNTVQYVICPAVFGAFENGMFYEVGHAFVAALLVARPDVDVYARMCYNRVVLFEDYPYSVV